MTEVLKCPTCSAPLDYPANGGPAVHCPYCNSTVLLPGYSTPGPENVSGSDLPPSLGALFGKRTELKEIAELLRAGNKIGAIRVYRRAFGSDLLTAKNAVENLHAGRPVAFSRAMTGSDVALQATKAATSVFKFGCGLAIVIALVTGIIVTVVVRSINRQVQTVKQTWAPSLIPKTAPGVPAASGFAHVVMEFGSKGIGAGQFKDFRSIAIDGAGHIYVGDYSDGRVQVFDAQGKFIKTWNIGPKKNLLDLTADRRGTVFAATSGHILAFEGATGLSLGEAAVTHDDTHEFYTDAFAALNGDLYAIGSASHIVILDSDGKIKSIIDANEKVGETVHFDKIVVNGLQEIYALDRSRGIFKFAPDGRYINRFGGGDDSGPTSLSNSHNLAVDGSGRIYVSGNGPAIRVFDGEGRYIDSFGGNDVVFGLAVNDQGEILACFRNQNVVRKFVLNQSKR